MQACLSMKLKVLTWNLRRATSTSRCWEYIRETNADILLLQEVTSIPTAVREAYSSLFEKATSKTGTPQRFGSAILVKGAITHQFLLRSSQDWVNKEIDFFRGNLLGCEALVYGGVPVKLISVYSPAWPIDPKRVTGNDIKSIKLAQNPALWCTELLWSGLKNQPNLSTENWIVAGDFNSSVTFDFMWGPKPRGNQEIIDRMNGIGLYECLSTLNGMLVPTFRNTCGGKIIHQMDHMYVSKPLLNALAVSEVGDKSHIFDNSLSDHLPIISEFDL
jgi:exonuclease III